MLNLDQLRIKIFIQYNNMPSTGGKTFTGTIVSSKAAKRVANACHVAASYGGASGGLCLGFTPRQCGIFNTETADTFTTYTLNSTVYTLSLSIDQDTAYAFGCVPTFDTPNYHTYFLLLTNTSPTATNFNSGTVANSVLSVTANTENTFGNAIGSSTTYILSVAAGGGGGGSVVGEGSFMPFYGGNGGSGGNLLFSNITGLLNNTYSFGIGAGGTSGKVWYNTSSPASGSWGGANTISGPPNMISTPSAGQYNVITTRIPSYVNSGVTTTFTNSSSGCNITLAGGNGGYSWNQTIEHDTPGNTAFYIPYPSLTPFELITGIDGNAFYSSVCEDCTGSVGYGGQATHTRTPFNGGMGISFGSGYNNGSTLEGIMPSIPCFAVSSTYFNNPESGHPVNFGGGGGGGGGEGGTGAWGAFTSNSDSWEQFYSDSSYYYAGKGGTANSSANANGQTGASCNGVPIYFGIYQTPVEGSTFYNCNFTNLGGGGGGGGAAGSSGEYVYGGLGGFGANGFTLLMWNEMVNGVPANCSNNVMTVNMPANGGTGPN